MRRRTKRSLTTSFVAVAACAALTACDAGFDGPLPPFSSGEVDTTKSLGLTLGADAVRFAVPVRVTPPTFDARVELTVIDATRPLRAEFLPEPFAGGPIESWAFVSTDSQLQTFLSGVDVEDLRLSLARDPSDVEDPIAVRMALRLVAPTDVDFDGVDDGVTVSFGTLSPLSP
jgi:hypothetical protein